ncbi:MAG TPA: hypothetical protein VGN13_06240 [Solirubrobacteraceae bacterium]
MSPRHGRSAAVAGAHPVVLDRRMRDSVRLGLSVLVPGLIALAVTVQLPSGDRAFVLGGIVAVIGIIALMVSSRLEVTVALLAIYLGMLDGPIKLLLGAHEATAAVPNLMILAVAVGAVMRMIVRKERARLPPLSSWVIAFVAVVAIEALNPKTAGVLKILGGFRQQLQFVPFFFFGFYLLRSKRRLRQLFLIAGVMALANGVVAAYQTGLTPTQLASWGPGYHNLIFTGEEGVGSGRVFFSEGEARVRPPGLGSEAGFGGGVGHIALPFCLALLAVSRRRKWVAALLCLGALVAVITSLGRSQVIGAGIGVVAFAGLAILAGRRVGKPLAALLAAVVLGAPAGVLVVNSLRSGTFKRYESIDLTSSSTTADKEGALSLIPKYLSAAPFGFGLGIVGPVSSVGGRQSELLEGHSVSSETQFNLVSDELGAPGLIIWTALSLYMVLVITRGMPKIRDGDLAILLAGFFAPFFALLFESTSGAFTDSAIAGPYFWLSIGVAAYWFAGPGRQPIQTLTRGRSARLGPG